MINIVNQMILFRQYSNFAPLISQPDQGVGGGVL